MFWIFIGKFSFILCLNLGAMGELKKSWLGGMSPNLYNIEWKTPLLLNRKFHYREGVRPQIGNCWGSPLPPSISSLRGETQAITLWRGAIPKILFLPSSTLLPQKFSALQCSTTPIQSVRLTTHWLYVTSSAWSLHHIYGNIQFLRIYLILYFP